MYFVCTDAFLQMCLACHGTIHEAFTLRCMDCQLPSCSKNLQAHGTRRKTILWQCDKCSLQVLPVYSAPVIKSHILAGPDDAEELKDY